MTEYAKITHHHRLSTGICTKSQNRIPGLKRKRPPEAHSALAEEVPEQAPHGGLSDD